MIDENERARMLKAYSIGPRMIAYLEEAGITRLEDLAGAEAELRSPCASISRPAAGR
jgi:hypothetical protein